MVVESVVVEVAVGKVRSVEEVKTILAMHHMLCIASIHLAPAHFQLRAHL